MFHCMFHICIYSVGDDSNYVAVNAATSVGGRFVVHVPFRYILCLCMPTCLGVDWNPIPGFFWLVPYAWYVPDPLWPCNEAAERGMNRPGVYVWQNSFQLSHTLAGNEGSVQCTPMAAVSTTAHPAVEINPKRFTTLCSEDGERSPPRSYIHLLMNTSCIIDLDCSADAVTSSRWAT